MKCALLLLLVLTGCPPTAVPQSDSQQFDHIVAGIEHYKKDSAVLEYALTNDDDPITKDCRVKGWPNTVDCRRVSLGIVITLQKYLDNKLPGVPRPYFVPRGAK